MEPLRVLLVHNRYTEKGGEDTVFESEWDALKRQDDIIVDQLIYNNKAGVLKSLINFLFLPWNPLSSRKLRTKIKAFDPDVIHLHNWFFTASLAVITEAKKMNVPVVVTVHNFRLLCPSATLYWDGNIHDEALISAFPWTAVQHKVYRNSYFLTFWLALSIFIHRKMKTFKMIDRYIFLNPFMREIFLASSLDLHRNQTSIKSNFLIEKTYEPSLKDDSYLFIGRLSEEKGIQTLIDAFSRYSKPLTVIGDGPFKAQVMKLAKNHKNIRYLGSLPPDLIIHHMLNSSALLVPSLWYEGMPMVILEAFACGLPVIASNLGAMKTMINHESNGLLFEPGSVDDFILTLKKWNELPDSLKTYYGENARSTFEKQYTAQDNMRILKDIYLSVKTRYDSHNFSK